MWYMGFMEHNGGYQVKLIMIFLRQQQKKLCHWEDKGTTNGAKEKQILKRA